MAAITGIVCDTITSDFEGAGTDGDVYVGIGGREFHLDSEEDDFEQNSWRDYVLGDPPVVLEANPQHKRVLHEERNDPRSTPPLDTDSLGLCNTPAYVRFEPSDGDDEWNLDYMGVYVFTERFVADRLVVCYTVSPGFTNLWLGPLSGKFVYLTQFIIKTSTGAPTLVDVRAQLAAKIGKEIKNPSDR